MNTQMLGKLAQWLYLVQVDSDEAREAISTRYGICDRLIRAICEIQSVSNELKSKFTDDGNFRLEYPMFLYSLMDIQRGLNQEVFDEFNEAVSPRDPSAPRGSMDALESIKSRIEVFISNLPDDVGILRSFDRDYPSDSPRRNFNTVVLGISNREPDLPVFFAGEKELEEIVDDLAQTIDRLGDYFYAAYEMANGMRGILRASAYDPSSADGDEELRR